ERDVFAGATATSLDCRLERGVQPFFRDDESRPERVEPLCQRALARQSRLEFLQRRVELALGVRRGNRVVERSGFFIEGQLVPLEHRNAGTQGAQLPCQVLMPETYRFLGRVGRLRLGQSRLRCRRIAVDIPKRPFGSGRFRSPLLRSVVRVDIVGIVLTERQHQLEVTLSEGIHRAVLRATKNAKICVAQRGVYTDDDDGQRGCCDNTALHRYRSRTFGMRYFSNAELKSYTGANPQSRRAAPSSTSSGQESTILCRFSSVPHPTTAPGKAAITASWICWAVGLNAVRLYAVRVSRSRGALARSRSAEIASGIAMNGMRVSGRTKHVYGSPP